MFPLVQGPQGDGSSVLSLSLSVCLSVSLTHTCTNTNTAHTHTHTTPPPHYKTPTQTHTHAGMHPHVTFGGKKKKVKPERQALPENEGRRSLRSRRAAPPFYGGR